MTNHDLEKLRRELERTRAELERSRSEIAHMRASKFWKLHDAWWGVKLRVLGFPPEEAVPKPASVAPAPPAPVAADVPSPPEILVHLRGSVVEVEACLDAVLRYSRPPYELTLVDDARPEPVRAFAERLAAAQGARYLRFEAALGYAGATNRAISESSATTFVVLDGTAHATPEWLERLLAAAAGPRTGLAAPLVAEAGELSPRAVSALAVQASARLKPSHDPAGAGCLLVRRAVLEGVGLFDETFRDSPSAAVADLCRRARGEGWAVVLADDAVVTDSPASPAEEGAGRVAVGIAGRARTIRERHRLRASGRARWEGKRVLFLLPITERGGGANVVLSEARAMTAMGVDARIWNRVEFQSFFERAYPGLDLPALYSTVEDLPRAAARFDAVIATVNTSVAWLLPLATTPGPPALGYYVQDFEPYFYEPGSEERRQALASYTLVPGLVPFTKTAWNRDQVRKYTGVECPVVGPSFDVDLFRPTLPELPAEPVRIAAMIRLSTPRRQPAFTLDVLEAVTKGLGPRVDVTLFGVEAKDPAFAALPARFPHRHAGVLHGDALVDLFNRTHVFADFSSFQAMGLVSLEAMACGATALVPMEGGSAAFAVHEENALVVDTSSREACVAALVRLATDRALLERLQARALRDVVRYAPEAVAVSILDALLPC